MKELTNIINWIESQAKSRGVNGLIILPDYTPNYNIVLELCKRTSYHSQEVSEKYNSLSSYQLAYDTIEQANKNNYLVVGNYDKIDLQLTRPWDNFCCIADIFPLGDMIKSEINNTFKALNIKYHSAHHLYGDKLNINSEELDWAYNINVDQIKFKGILDSNKDPTKHQFWFSFNRRQKEILSYLYQHIKATEHIVVEKPTYKINNHLG